MTADSEALASRVAALAQEREATVGVVESLTGGLLASHLARAEDAAAWFRGGIVAYGRDVKHWLLDVRPGPVVSEQAAIDMVDAALRLLDVDLALAVTGVGGPGPQDGQAPGTVWVATSVDGSVATIRCRLDGDPSEVCHGSVTAALAHLLEQIEA